MNSGHELLHAIMAIITPACSNVLSACVTVISYSMSYVVYFYSCLGVFYGPCCWNKRTDVLLWSLLARVNGMCDRSVLFIRRSSSIHAELLSVCAIQFQRCLGCSWLYGCPCFYISAVPCSISSSLSLSVRFFLLLLLSVSLVAVQIQFVVSNARQTHCDATTACLSDC